MERSVWKVQGTQLTKNGDPFFLKGVCYSPTPITYATFTPQIGDWFYDKCAVLWRSQEPDDRGDLKTMRGLGINHLRTYFWWRWQWPTDDSIGWVLRKGWKDANAPTFDHTPFLDECAKNGIYVMLGLAVNSGDIFEGPEKNRPFFRELYVDTAAEIGRLYGSHPAVIGLCVGNEQNQPGRNSNPDFWAGLKEMSSAFKNNAPGKVTMIAFQNDAALFDTLVNDVPLPEIFKQSFDVYGLNIYGDLTASLANFHDKVIAAHDGAYALPLIVSEWGVGGGVNYMNPKYDDPSFNFPKTRSVPGGGTEEIKPLEGPPFGIALSRECTSEEFQVKSQNLAAYFKQITDNKTFVVGGQYFAWSDEWWKNYTDQKIIDAIDSKHLTLDQWGRYKFPYPFQEGNFPEYRIPSRLGDHDSSSSPDWPEEWWGLYRIARNPKGPIGWNQWGMYNADVLSARPTVDALKDAYSSE
ncbi:MAG: hypothetical protein JWP63_1580 [Candidatus Solibacter sp.]|nr:hypothetical protein [Candidatus Solibacter sp.]